jgi:hypothetical protein
MTPAEYLLANGYDPSKYTIDAEGYPTPLPPKKKIGALATIGANAGRSMLPALAALKAGAEVGGATSATMSPYVGVPAGIIAALAAGFGANKLQGAALDAVAPSVNEFVDESRAQNPVAGYIGDFIPNALAMKPDIKGVRALANAMTPGFARTPAGTAALVNVGANVAGSTAGQLAKMSQGGDFSLGEFAADTALGTLFNEPTKLGRRLGFESTRSVSDMKTPNDLEASQIDAAFNRAASAPSDPMSRPTSLEPDAVPVGEAAGPTYVPSEAAYERWWRSNAEPTVDIIAQAAKQHKLRLPKERIAEIANEPYAAEIAAGNYENWPEFVAMQSERALESALNTGKINEAWLRSSDEGYSEYTETPVVDKKTGQVKKFDAQPPRFEDMPERYPVMSAEEVAAQQATAAERAAKLTEIREKNARLLAENRAKQAANEQAMLGQQMGAERERLANLRSILQGEEQRLLALQAKAERSLARGNTRAAESIPAVDEPLTPREDWLNPTDDDIAAVQLNDEDLALRANEQRLTDDQNMKQLEEAQALVDETVKERTTGEAELAETQRQWGRKLPDADEQRAKMEQLRKNEETARQIRDELYARFQKDIDSGEAAGPLTQAQLDAVTDILNKRGVRVKLADIDANGVWEQVGNDVTVTINPMTARLDTLIEELGHDTFNRSATPWMQKKLSAAIEENARYKSELARRLAAGEDPQRAEDIAREEGLMDVFRMRTGADKAELASWWKAFKGSMKAMVGAKLSPEDAMAWLHYATHENVPWNTRGGAKGVTGAETREQPLDPFNSVVGKLRQTSPQHAKVADDVKSAYETRDYLEGQLRRYFEPALAAAPESVRVSVLDKMHRQMETNTPATFTAEERPLADGIRKFLKSIPDMYNAAGFKIRSDSGILRDRAAWDNYFPSHRQSDEVQSIFRDASRVAERQPLVDEFLRYTEDWYIKNGSTPEEAKAKAADQLDKEIGAKQGGAASYDASFAGSRRPIGPPLPPSWRSRDLASVLENYTQRTATDFAFQKHVESQADTMASLGAKTWLNGAPIDAATLRANAPLNNEPSVQTLLRSYNRIPTQMGNRAVQGASQLVGSLALAHVSKAKDLTGTTFGWLKYLQGSDYLPGALDFAGRLSDWGAQAARSYDSGLNRRDSEAQMRAVVGTGEKVGDWMTKAAETITKYTGINKLEQASRTIAQAAGETFVAIARPQAMSGNKKYAEFFDKLSPDWRSRTDADLAAQFGRLMQGTYDARSVPAWALEGPAAPFFVWNRWSLGQYNNFKQFAMEPLMRGDAKPLIGHLLIGMLGGSAVDAVSQWMNNRDGRDVKWDELQAWLQEHEADGNVYELAGEKMMNLMQHVGTFGYMGDLVKSLTESLGSGSPQLPATMPLAGFVNDGFKRATAAIKALDEGQDFGLVMREALKDEAYSASQIARTARNWLDEDLTMEANDKRRMRLFDKLNGESGSGNAFAISYSNVGEKKLDKATMDDDIAGIAGDLVTQAATESTSQEEFRDRLRKLTTSQRGIMPTRPTKAAEYLKWLTDIDPALATDVDYRAKSAKELDRYKDVLVRQAAQGQTIGH